MSKTQYASIKPIALAIDDLINSLGIKRKLQEYDAVVYWESAVGEQIAKVTRAIRILKGVLIISVKTSTWRNELTFRKREIIDKLNDAMGKEIVKDIKFQ
jgi:predicted nucleic acid-binding Zn ribbon protein